MDNPTIGIVNPHAAGIDVGAAEVYACIPADREGPRVRSFATYTPDLEALANWLLSHQVDTVALESTGVYWIPIYEILTARGLRVEVVNARHLKHVPGRKSDVQDCQWIQQLHSFGLLRGSFRPTEDIVVLRSLLRHRETLVTGRASHVNRMQKALTVMNVRLAEVVTDITGVSGMGIVRAIVSGERDAHKLARFRQKGCKHTEEDFIKAMTGHYKAEELFALTQEVALYDTYTHSIQECEAEIERQFSVTRPRHDDDLPPLGKSTKTNTHSKNAPAYDAREAMYKITGVDLTEIDGINESTAQTILSEIGTDMSRFPSEKHLSSWLGLVPKNDISGGKVLRSRILKVPSRAGQALRLAAQSLSKSNTWLGMFYRRIRARSGSSQAIVATAHKLICIIYHMLKDRQPYRRIPIEEYDRLQHDRAVRSLKIQADRLGFEVTPQS